MHAGDIGCNEICLPILNACDIVRMHARQYMMSQQKTISQNKIVPETWRCWFRVSGGTRCPMNWQKKAVFIFHIPSVFIVFGKTHVRGLIPRADVLGWICLLWVSIWNNSTILIIFKTTFIANKWITWRSNVTTIVSRTTDSRFLRTVTEGRESPFIHLQLLQKDNDGQMTAENNDGHMTGGIFVYVCHNENGCYFYKTLITSDVTRDIDIVYAFPDLYIDSQSMLNHCREMIGTHCKYIFTGLFLTIEVL